MKFLVLPNAPRGGGDDLGCSPQTCTCYQAINYSTCGEDCTLYCGTYDPCSGYLCFAYATKSI